MAVFTAIASAIIAGLSSTLTFGAVFAAAGSLTALGIGTSLLAGGIAVATARASGVFKPAGIQQSKDPGVKIQLQPSTDNRIPVFYGKVHTGAIAVDAGIKNQNNTMIYVTVISEQTDTGTYSVQSIKRNDATLNFGTGVSNKANVISQTDPNATSTTTIANKIRCRVYAGGTAASNQIFPASGTQVAATTLLSTINATTNYDGLVYAVFEMDYDVENGLTQLGTITYEITNSLSEPSNVILDYAKNSRYGAGLSTSDLETAGFDDLYDYSTEQVDFTNSVGGTSQHDRWRIDGMMSTYQDVKSNIDRLCQSCSTFFTYNPKIGKFTVVPNRAATTAEKSAAFVFDDDNIVGKIAISGTELYSLYNSIEAEYPSVIKQDQTNTVLVSTPSGERNNNEPANELQTRFDYVNDAPRVHNLANIDLRQSRISTMVEFEATYEGIQVNVGDVVKLTSALYGYTNKLFRVMRTTEIEKPDGMLLCKVILMEYNDSVYTHNVVQTDSVVGIPNIPGWWTLYGNSNVILGNTIITDPTTGTANIVNSGNGNVVGNIDYGNIDWANISFGGIGGLGGTTIIPSSPVAIMDITVPDVPGIETIDIDINTSDTNTPKYKSTTNNTFPNPFGGTWAPNQRAFVALPLPNNPPAEDTEGILPNFPELEVESLYNFNVGGQAAGGFGINLATIPDVVLDNKGITDVAAVQDMGIGYNLDTSDLYSTMPFAGPTGIGYTTAAASSNNQLVFNETIGGDAVPGSLILGTGVPTGALVVEVIQPSTITSNATMSVASGTNIAINNANITAIGESGSFYTPSTTTALGGIDLGDFSHMNSITPFGTLPGGGAAINYGLRASVTYEEVATANNEPTGNTIVDVQESPVIENVFSNAIPPSLVNNWKFPITTAQGQTAATAVYNAAGVTPPTGMTYVPQTLVSQPMGNSSMQAVGAQQQGAATKVEILRATKADRFRDLR